MPYDTDSMTIRLILDNATREQAREMSLRFYPEDAEWASRFADAIHMTGCCRLPRSRNTSWRAPTILSAR